ncbi:DNA-binding protein [Hanstruepera neustonica]|uniref:DNA-binding protein n=1 Tax=Hanstruepera neustonica TaxID=1445657 RepID=A0A2K1DXM6_9FLAO|nr:helix-turn-helix domain-containing protein [Hanstruepera neustonica]PNQ72792.1 DNA-binding protein [Hanstruepera neustonica]
MTLDLITKDDLKTLKQEIITELRTILGGQTEQKKWLKSADVREMLNISPGTLQNLRVNGTLPYTMMGKTIYYEYNDVIKILTQNKSA